MHQVVAVEPRQVAAVERSLAAVGGWHQVAAVATPQVGAAAAFQVAVPPRVVTLARAVAPGLARVAVRKAAVLAPIQIPRLARAA